MLKLEANIDEYKLKAMAGGDPQVMITIKGRINVERDGEKMLRLLGQPCSITFVGHQLEMVLEEPETADDQEEPEGLRATA